MEAMGGAEDKRKHKRLPVRAAVFCRKVGSLHNDAFEGDTLNISPDGLLVESRQSATIEVGDLFNVELDIPDTDSTVRFGGKVSAYARIVRIVDLQPQPKGSRKHIAFQFCTRPQFDI
jgi:hypothetical protein